MLHTVFLCAPRVIAVARGFLVPKSQRVAASSGCFCNSVSFSITVAKIRLFFNARKHFAVYFRKHSELVRNHYKPLEYYNSPLTYRSLIDTHCYHVVHRMVHYCYI